MSYFNYVLGQGPFLKLHVHVGHKYVNYKVQCHTSTIGLDANTFFSILVSAVAPPIEAKYLRTYLALTVLPDPLSPDMIID